MVIARRTDALVDLEGMAPLHERFRLHPGEVVMVLAVAAADEGHVAEALGRDIGDRRALALQQGIGGDCRAKPDAGDGVGLRRMPSGRS